MSNSKPLRIAICQLENHSAVNVNGYCQIYEPFTSKPEISLRALKAQGLEVGGLQEDCQHHYVEWHTKRVSALLMAIEETDSDLVLLPEGSIPWQGLSQIGDWSATTGACVLAGSHTPVLTRDALRLYRELGLSEDIIEDAKAGRVSSFLPAFNSGVLHAFVKTSLSPFEGSTSQPLPDGYSQEGSQRRAPLVVQQGQIRVLPLICSEALQASNLPDTDLVAVVAYQADPTRFQAFFQHLINNRKYVAFCNDGRFGGSTFLWFRDKRYGDPLKLVLNESLPKGDSVLVVDVDTQIRAVEVGTAAPKRAVGLVGINAITYHNTSASKLSAAASRLRSQTDPTTRSRSLADSLGDFEPTPLQAIKYGYLADLDKQGTPSKHEWDIFGSDIVLQGLVSLRTLEEDMASRCAEELPKSLSSIADKSETAQIFVSFLRVCNKLGQRHEPEMRSQEVLSAPAQSVPAAVIAGIIGRDHDVEKVDQFLSDTRELILEVTGLQEIGKSAVIDLALSQAKIRPLRRIRVHDTSTPDYLISSLLGNHGSPPPYEDPTQICSSDEFRRCLAGIRVLLLSDLSSLLVRGEWREPEMAIVFRYMLEAAEYWNVKIILESRQFVPVDAALVPRRQRLRVHGLSGERRHHGVRLLNARLRLAEFPTDAVTEERKLQVVDILGGHPVGIALAADVCAEVGPKTLEDVLDTERGYFLNYIEKLVEALSLNEVEYDALALLARADSGAPAAALSHALPHLSDSGLRHLVSLGAASWRKGRLLELSDVLSHHFVRRELSDDLKQTFHRSVSIEMLELAEAEPEQETYYRLEAAFHAEMAGDPIPAGIGLLDSSLRTAKALMNDQRFDEATILLHRILQIRDSLSVRRLAAINSAKSGDFESSLRHARIVFESSPNDTSLLHTLGKIALSLFQDRPGQQLVEMAHDVGVESDAVYTVEARLYLRRGQLREAERVLLRAKELSVNNPWPYYYLGDTYMRLGTIDLAKKEFESGEKFYLTHSSSNRSALLAIRSKLCLCHLMEGNLTAAKEMIADVLRDDPNQPQALQIFGQVVDTIGTSDGKDVFMERIRNAHGKSRSDRSSIQFLLAQELKEAGDWRGAAEHYRSACEADRTNLYARLEYARFVIALGIPEEPAAERSLRDTAMRFLDEVLKYDPENSAVQRLRSDLAAS